MTVTISRLYDSYAQATEAVSNLEKAEFRIATSALSQTTLIIGILKIPPEGRQAVPLPSIVIATEWTTGPKGPARVLESARPRAASSGYSLDLGYSQYQASGPSLPPDGLWLQRQVLRLAAQPVALLVH